MGALLTFPWVMDAPREGGQRPPRDRRRARRAERFRAHQVGPYRIAKQLGAGATAITYLAHDTSHAGEAAPLVCLKVLHPAYARNPTFADAFMGEAMITPTLHHPHIVTLQDVGRDPRRGPYCLVPLISPGRVPAEVPGAEAGMRSGNGVPSGARQAAGRAGRDTIGVRVPTVDEDGTAPAACPVPDHHARVLVR